MVANSAAVSDWLLNVEGGGWEYAACERFPASIRGALAGFFAVEEAELDSTPSVVFTIKAADDPEEPAFYADAIYSLMSRGPAATRGVQPLFPFAQQFQFGITGPRLMRAAVLVDRVELAAVTFNVSQKKTS